MDPATILAISGGISSGASGLLGPIISAATSRRDARYQAALQLTNQYAAAQNLPSYQREGLVKAGYNPLLAVGGAGAAGANSAIQVAGQDLSGLSQIGSGLDDIASAKLAEKERKKQEEKDKHMQDNADKLLDAQLSQIKATVDNIGTHSAQRRLENKILQNKINDSGSIFESLNHFKRGAGDLARSAWKLYNDNIGQPFANAVHKVFK